MTINGTITKTGFSLLILIMTASWIWSSTPIGPNMVPPVAPMFLGMIAGLILAFVTIFKMQWAPITVPLYAGFEGLAIGGLSVIFEARFPGIVIQAVGLTFGTLFAMLILCDRARRRGVTQVDFVVQDGNIRKQLRLFAIETRAKVMVMGRPIRSPGRNIFQTAEFEAFVAELEQDGNLHVIQVVPSPA